MGLNSKEFEGLASDSITTLRKALKQQRITGVEAQKVSIAKSALASYTRFLQVNSALTATKTMVIRDLASSKEELQQYLATSVPELNIIKCLNKG